MQNRKYSMLFFQFTFFFIIFKTHSIQSLSVSLYEFRLGRLCTLNIIPTLKRYDNENELCVIWKLDFSDFGLRDRRLRRILMFDMIRYNAHGKSVMNCFEFRMHFCKERQFKYIWAPNGMNFKWRNSKTKTRWTRKHCVKKDNLKNRELLSYIVTESCRVRAIHKCIVEWVRFAYSMSSMLFVVCLIIWYERKMIT